MQVDRLSHKVEKEILRGHSDTAVATAQPGNFGQIRSGSHFVEFVISSSGRSLQSSCAWSTPTCLCDLRACQARPCSPVATRSLRYLMRRGPCSLPHPCVLLELRLGQSLTEEAVERPRSTGAPEVERGGQGGAGGRDHPESTAAGAQQQGTQAETHWKEWCECPAIVQCYSFAVGIFCSLLHPFRIWDLKDSDSHRIYSIDLGERERGVCVWEKSG